MTIIARPASPGTGFDCSVKPTPAQARALKAMDHTLVGRYVPLPANNAANDIDAAELIMLTDLGFEVLLVQHVRTPPWDPRAHSGTIDAAVACEHALDAGYPLGAHLYLDLEGLVATADVAGAKLFVESWATRVLADGFKAGLYVGYDLPLSPTDLWLLHGINTYWTDAAHHHVANRGCAIVQGRELTVRGVRIDEDTIAPDMLGELPFIAAAAPAVA
jgi:Domain of unknown function (DUF1906)